MLDRPATIYPRHAREYKPQPTKIVLLPSQMPKDSPLVFTPEQCQWIINYGRELRSAPAEVGGSPTGQVNKSIRDANIHTFPLNELTEPLYRKVMLIGDTVNDEYGYDIDGIPHQFQLIRYEVGGHYKWHTDNGGIQFQDRKISMVVNLSDPRDYDGGALLINDSNPIELPREQGMVSTFPSYTLHTVQPVTRGTRWSLVSWITGRPFR